MSTGDLEALIAEVAALREENGGLAEAAARPEARLLRATEAERKLAEAVGLVEPFVDAVECIDDDVPGWRVFGIADDRDIQSQPGWGAGVGEKTGPGIEHARAPSPALSLCMAVLRAKAQEG